MDKYTFYQTGDSYIESDIHALVTHNLQRQQAETLSIRHNQRMATWLYDQGPLPPFIYTHTTSAYTTLVQWYVCLGQLPTVECMKIRGSNIDSECRFGCGKIEDMHHVFVECRRFKDMRKETADSILKMTANIISKFSLKEATVECLLTKAESSFVDCAETWPPQYSAFYLGHIPRIDNIVNTSAFENRVTEWQFFHAIHCAWHAASVRLTLRIWGDVQREMARRNDLLAGRIRSWKDMKV